MMPIHPHDRDYHTVLKEDMQAVIEADRLGFDAFWLGEHITAASEPITSPLLFLAQAIPQTKNIKLCTGVINLPQQHPATVAAHTAMFDQMCAGRFVMGISSGGLPSDYELFQLEDASTRGKMMLESIDMIQHLWTQDPPYDLKGQYWHVKIDDWYCPEYGLGTMRRPFQNPHPPIAMSAMSPFSKTVQIAASRGWNVVTANFIATSSVASHWKMFQKGSSKAGLEPDSNKWSVARNILVTDRDADAAEYLARPDNALAHYYKYMIELFKRAGFTVILKPDEQMSDDELTSTWAIDNFVIAGSPQTVANKILAFRDEVGPFGTIAMVAHDWDDPAIHRRSMQLMAEQVMPRLNEAVG